MGSFGQSLREARENLGISLEEVSKATKIRTAYLVALEGDDFERLPDNVFIRGFVRAYAEVVGLDPDVAVAASAVERKACGSEGAEQSTDVLAELDRLIPDKAPPAERRFSRRRLLLGAGAVMVVGVFVLASWLIVGRDAREPIARAQAAALREPAPVSVTPPPAVPHLTPPRAVEEPVRTASSPEIRVTSPIPKLAAPPLAIGEPARPLNQAPTSSLSVPDFAVGRGVANRRVVDPSDSFDEGQTVWFWTRVEGAATGDRIRHVWLHAGQQVHTIDLELGGASWRTQSTKRMRPGSSGIWRVEARDAAGRVLAASDFVCE